jgi:hypothetical protein
MPERRRLLKGTRITPKGRCGPKKSPLSNLGCLECHNQNRIRRFAKGLNTIEA